MCALPPRCPTPPGSETKRSTWAPHSRRGSACSQDTLKPQREETRLSSITNEDALGVLPCAEPVSLRSSQRPLGTASFRLWLNHPFSAHLPDRCHGGTPMMHPQPESCFQRGHFASSTVLPLQKSPAGCSLITALSLAGGRALAPAARPCSPSATSDYQLALLCRAFSRNLPSMWVPHCCHNTAFILGGGTRGSLRGWGASESLHSMPQNGTAFPVTASPAT